MRFVFHYSLPKSLEGYLQASGQAACLPPARLACLRKACCHRLISRPPSPTNCPAAPCYHFQESGRAGRDGRPSSCILYYTFADAAKSRHMIRQSAQENGAPEEQTRSNMESLNAMVSQTEGMGRRQCGLMEGDGKTWGDASVGLLLLSGWKGWPCSDAAPLAACPSCSNLRVACTAVPPPLLISTPKSTQTSAWHSNTLPSCCLPPAPRSTTARSRWSAGGC